MTDLIDILRKRRSIYNISNNLPIDVMQVKNLITEAVKISPSAFNSQSARIVVLLNENHLKFWNIVLENLKKIVAKKNFETTQKRINNFSEGYGTILFFEDMNIVHNFEQKYPEYANNITIWAEQSNAILEYIIWTLLADKNIGASIQHYNPIIDEDVKKEFKINNSWKLIAQMPFGNIAKPAAQKNIENVSKRVKFLI